VTIHGNHLDLNNHVFNGINKPMLTGDSAGPYFFTLLILQYLDSASSSARVLLEFLQKSRQFAHGQRCILMQQLKALLSIFGENDLIHDAGLLVVVFEHAIDELLGRFIFFHLIYFTSLHLLQSAVDHLGELFVIIYNVLVGHWNKTE